MRRKLWINAVKLIEFEQFFGCHCQKLTNGIQNCTTKQGSAKNGNRVGIFQEINANKLPYMHYAYSCSQKWNTWQATHLWNWILTGLVIKRLVQMMKEMKRKMRCVFDTKAFELFGFSFIDFEIWILFWINWMKTHLKCEKPVNDKEVSQSKRNMQNKRKKQHIELKYDWDILKFFQFNENDIIQSILLLYCVWSRRTT